MKSKTGIIVSSGLILAGIVIGVSVRKDHTVTQLVAVPIRVPIVTEVVTAAAPAEPVASKATEPPVAAPADAPATYTAKPGDTLSNVAAGLLGADNRSNRDKVVSASPSLQANPDLVVTGREYTLPPKGSVSAQPEVSPVVKQPTVVDETPAPVATPAPAVTPAPVLKYTASKGDTVTDLAGALLGGDTQANRDAIVNANPSLKANPDHLLAGKAYRIPTPEGGLAAAAVSPTPVTARPTTQPDADQLVKDDQSRALRYTAKAGDTVSSLAQALLGSDTDANRKAIINANASLKSNPDMVVEGKTYWIPAPVAAVTQAE